MLTTASPRPALRLLRGWPLFLALSLCVHLLLLLPGHHLPSASPPASDAPVPLTVQIVSVPPSTQPAPATAPSPRPAAAPPSPAAAAKAAAAPKPAAPSAVATPLPAQRADVPPPPFNERELGTSQRLLDTFQTIPLPTPAPGAPAAQEPPGDEESRLHIESLIRTRFAEHFIYPPMAQHRGWQGEVVLAFRIGTDGTISQLQVVRSSGHAILDEAALATMRRLGRIEFSPGVVLHRVLELRMPVIYQLARG